MYSSLWSNSAMFFFSQEFLDRRKMTEFGSLSLVDEGTGDGDGVELNLPGVKRGESTSHWLVNLPISVAEHFVYKSFECIIAYIIYTGFCMQLSCLSLLICQVIWAPDALNQRSVLALSAFHLPVEFVFTAQHTDKRFQYN